MQCLSRGNGPVEGDPKPSETPYRLVLAEEDLDRIAAAIRKGLGDGPPDGKKLALDVVKVVGIFCLLVLLYLILTHWRPAVDISVRANALSTPQVLTHGPDEGNVAWQFGTGEVRALKVDELRAAEESEPGEFVIALPILPAECDEVAARLDAACDDSVIEVQAPVTVAWTEPQVLRLERATTDDQVPSDAAPRELTLTVQRSTADPAPMTRESAEEPAEESESVPATPPQPQLTIIDSQAASQQWCFSYQRNSAAMLSISGGAEGYRRTFEPASAPDVGCDGLRLLVNPGAASDDPQGGSEAATPNTASQSPDRPQRASSIVTLSGIASLDVTTESRHLNASALTGSLTLPQDTRVFDPAAQADFTAGEPITTRLGIQAGTPSLTIDGGGVTAIETDRGNLVSTLWQRNTELILPIFIGVVGVFTPLLGTVYHNGVEYLASRRSGTRSATDQVSGP